MTVDFIQEDGTGLSNATSYVSIVEMQQYWFNQDYDYSLLSDEEMQRLLNKSTAYVDSNYSFPGYRTSSTQSLEFPRSSAYYLDGYEIDDDVVPNEVKNAVSEMAYLINTGETPNSVISKSGKVIKESSQVDVIKESYTYEEGSVLYTDIYASVDSLLYRLTGGVSNNFILKVVRVGGESA